MTAAGSCKDESRDVLGGNTVRIAKVNIKNFRCLQDLDLEVNELTVLIGANSAGKSSVLKALRWFFEGGPLDTEDVCGHRPEAQVSVGVTFSGLTHADQEALGSYATKDTATFWRTWSEEKGEKLTGHALAYPPFEEIRVHEKATPRKRAYSELRNADPTLGLPSATSTRDAVDAAMLAWESDNSDKLEPATSSATHLFGFSGQPKLAGRFDYVFVPAVSDAEEQTRHARGTLMQQVISRSLNNQEQVDERLKIIHTETAEQMSAILQEEHGDELEELSHRFTNALRAYVPSGTISFRPQSPELKMPSMQVDLRVADSGVETNVGRQGNGFQRALLMAAVQELSRVQEIGDPPALFLAIEEPELYQHPAQARHFAKTLSELPRNGEGAIQVAYATHSEYFVDPSRYESLRRFRKEVDGLPDCPTARLSFATTDRVANRLSNIIPSAHIPKKIAITLRRTLSEAVFAHAVILVEGWTDAAVLEGVADREGGFDAMGVAVIEVGGKMNIPVPWGILEELGIPSFVVFDADRGSVKPSDIENAKRWNKNILSLLNAAEEDWPATGVYPRHVVFEDRLEDELKRSWPEMLEHVGKLKVESNDWRPKPEDCYRQAAYEVGGNVPDLLANIIAAVKAL